MGRVRRSVYFYDGHMYELLEPEQKKRVESLYQAMSLEEKISQTYCIHMETMSADEVTAKLKDLPDPGGVFFAYRSAEDCRGIMDAVNSRSRTPILGTADLVNGAGSRIQGATLFPWQMALGAADDEDLAYKMGLATAVEGRDAGLHWTFGPIVDLNINNGNSMMHTRAFGEKPSHVLRTAQAFIRGVQEENRMAATAKHYPGDGIDERDSHVCTSINSLSEKEWMESFGRVWQGVIDAGVKTVMSGHIALPWAAPGTNYLGPMPATLSKELQIDLLRKRLGFKGVIISDATPMIGYSAMAGKSTRNVLNIETGSDMILWLRPEEETGYMKQALETGLLSENRLETAVKNILGLKLDLGLLDNKEPPSSSYTVRDFESWADTIGEKSIAVVRNESNLLPLRLKNGAKLLTVTVSFDEDTRGYVKDLSVVDKELRDRGFEVDHLERPGSKELSEAAPAYDAVFINVHVMPRYGTTRFFGNATACLWDSFWPEHPCVVFTSFGDPYKFWEMPYCPNFVNTFSNTPSSQKAAVKVWLGEIGAQGKSPVRCEGFFEIEVR